MHIELQKYLDGLHKKYNLKFPKFCSTFSDDINAKKYLAILQDPGNSSPEKTSGQCSILNDDPTSFNQRDVIDRNQIEYEKILFWNFYAFFGFKEQKKYIKGAAEWEKLNETWALEVRNLQLLLPEVRVIVVLGSAAKKGMKDFNQMANIPIRRGPHPSAQSFNRPGGKERREELFATWRKAKDIAEP